MRRRTVLLLTATMAALVAVLVASGLASAQSTGATFIVNSAADPGGGGCNATECTLREAITAANANVNAPLVDAINFNIPGAGPHTISPTGSDLPQLFEPVTIDGYTEPGSVKNTAAFGSNATLNIVINGASAPQGSNGLGVSGGSTTIRGLVINGFQSFQGSGNGIILFVQSANTNNVIEGNYIGTNAAGNTAVPNQGNGVIATGGQSTGNRIGGTTPDKRNLISANLGHGVELDSNANTVQGNLIGTFQTGAGDLGNNGDGVHILGGDKNLISDNVIAGNNTDGVSVKNSSTTNVSTGNRILSNSVFSNNNLGIDLDPGGREQDAKDPDTGPNNLQNYPVITTATTTGTTTTIKGTLDSRPRKTFTIQFFSNPTGEDEGKTYLGQVNVRTNKQGKSSFSVLGPAVTAGNITATATNVATGDTSEFSDPVVVTTS